tara:strand:+ start:7112 stop:7876 length:765 start_codon:yes stop_codon:yes gene_type:complete
MIKYNFAKNYKTIKLWSYKNINKPISSNTNQDLSIVSKFLGYLPKIKYLNKFSKSNKILFAPSFSIIALTLLIQFISLIPRINIKRLENYHYSYEDNVNQLSDINRSLESDFNSFIKYASLYAISAPDYLFGYYLQSLIPAGVQLSDYTIDNYGFKINAIGSDIISINKLLNLLLDNKLVESDSLKLMRLIDQSKLTNDSIDNNQLKAGVVIEITGKLSKLSLKNTIELNKNAFNYGTLSKLNKYSNILNLFIR